MTQQQKIAAALVKAGISNPAAWAVAGISPQAAARERVIDLCGGRSFAGIARGKRPENKRKLSIFTLQ